MSLGGAVITVVEIARDCRVSKMTVYRWVNDGMIPHTRIGRVIRIERADYEEFLKANKHNAQE